jgi:hypothetical protein
MANLAQMVNAIAPIVTTPDTAIVQPIWYPANVFIASIIGSPEINLYGGSGFCRRVAGARVAAATGGSAWLVRLPGAEGHRGLHFFDPDSELAIT